MGVESKIRELMEGAANRPADKSQGDATNPTQGDSNPNPEQQDLSGTDANGGLTSSVGKEASNKEKKDNTLPAGNGAKEAVSNMENKEDSESVVMQPSSKGNVHQEETETEEEVVAETTETEEEFVEDVLEASLYEEDLAKLFEGDETLTEEFKTKAGEIFEAVVTARVASEISEIEEEIIEQANTAIQGEVDKMVENIDKYLAYVTEQWMVENKIALESSLRTEITESFIKDLQKVFTENYIEVPEEKFDVVEEMDTQVKSLKEELDEKIEENIKLVEEAVSLKKEKVLSIVSEDLADTEAEKFSTLVEDVAYTGEEAYKAKLDIIKENYFPKDKAAAEAVLEDTGESVEVSEETTNVMNKYAAAITNSSKF